MINKVEICGINTSTLPKLTVKEQGEYLERIKKGDKEARDYFIVANMRLVLSVIKRFWGKKENVDDLFQAGMVGLIKSVDNFDTTVGVLFSTYAVPMIIGEIKRVVKGANSLRVARSIRDMAYLALKTRSEMEKDGEEVTPTDIANRLNVAVTEVTCALDAISDTVSLYDPVYSKNGDELLLMDQIGDEKNTEENWTEKYALKNAIENLEYRERKILELRYFEGKTQTEISAYLGLSQAQVSRIEKTALLEIKNGLRVY